MNDKNRQIEQPSQDVIIVGAGIAGLTAAHELTKRGISVCILEANDRIGGRILDIKSKHGHILPLGATWIGPDEEKVPALMAEAGLETVPQYETGDVIVRLCGTQQVAPSTDDARVGPFPLPAEGIPEDFLQAIHILDQLCQEISLERPYDHPRAAEWDQITAAEWLETVGKSEKGKALLHLVVGGELCAELEDFSFLCLLFLWRSIIVPMIDDRRIKGGPHQLVQWLSKQIGERIHLQSPVHAIQQDDDSVTVHTNQQTVMGKYLIMTIPPHLHTPIEFQPPLPESHRQVTSKSQMGKAIKVFVVYPTAFWRTMGLSGMSLTDDGILNSTFDVSPEDSEHGMLVGFISGRRARLWHDRSPEEREVAVMEQLINLFGEQAASPIDYVEHNWIAEPWTGGCYCAIMPTNVLAAHGPAIRTPVERIHWAGTETAALWYGSMEGAITSGERAAQEVAERLQLG